MACFVELTTNKERSTLEHSVVKTLSQLLNCEVYLLQLYDDRGEYDPQIGFWQNNESNNAVDSVNQSSNNNSGNSGNKLEFCGLGLENTVKEYLIALESQPAIELYAQDQKVFWPLYIGESCLDILILERTNPCPEELGLLSAIGAIFANFMELLDAGERDALTGLYNRRVFDTRLNALVEKSAHVHKQTNERRAKSTQLFNFLGIIDIDFFKRVNDDFGHLFGDEVLLWLAQQMRQCFRNEDALFRYGGEEFAVLLAGLNQQQAQETFERFRKAISQTTFPQIGHITVSIGYTCIDAQANPTLLFGQADQALYYAKENGRNRVECYAKLAVEGKIEVDTDMEDIELF